MVKFTEVIGSSIEWTTTVLFRPFNPKKWLILGFVALMAGYSAGGGNFGSSGYDSVKGKKAEAQEVSPASLDSANQDTQRKTTSDPRQFLGDIYKQITKPMAVVFILIGATIFLIVIAILMWLSSRFSFIFLEDVVKNDASIKIPFRENRSLGNSLFLFNLAVLVISLIFLGAIAFLFFKALIGAGVFNKTLSIGLKKLFFTCLPYFFFFAGYILLLIVINLIINDFVLVAMFKEKIKIVRGWNNICSLISANKAKFIKYFFIKIGLYICSIIIYALIILAVFLVIILPAVVIGAILTFIYNILPPAFHLIYNILLVVAFAPVVLFLIYCILCLNLPFAVFFRTFSLKFLGRLAPQYDLFKLA